MHVNQYKANILHVFAKRTDADVINGFAWYGQAKEQARSLASEFGVSLKTACDVIAALSPNNRWTRNVADAWKVCRTWRDSGLFPFDDEKTMSIEAFNFTMLHEKIINCKVGTYTRNKRKAFAILAGLDTLSGQKVTAFSDAISGKFESVTVDVHAFSIANGVRYTTQDCPAITKREYQTIARAYTLAANHIVSKGIAKTLKPSELQSICWVVWRRLHNIAYAVESTAKLF